MTVKELIAMLSDCDPDATVRLATQPRYPFAHTISDVQEVQADRDEGHDVKEGDAVVYIAEGRQVDYLCTAAREALGWGRD